MTTIASLMENKQSQVQDTKSPVQQNDAVVDKGHEDIKFVESFLFLQSPNLKELPVVQLSFPPEVRNSFSPNQFDF
jgi:hypothetical protein